MAHHPLSSALKSLLTGGFLVSYPKCGRTWLALMLGELLSIRSRHRPDNPLLLKRYRDPLRRVPKIRVSHDNNPHETPLDQVDSDSFLYRWSRTVFLYRDPRDVVVSLWFHNRKRSERDVGSLEDFIWRGTGGLPTIVRFYNLWIEKANHAGRIHYLAYEDLRADTVQQLHTVARFFRIPGCDEDRVRQAVDEHDFQRMRQRERSNAYATDRIQARDPDDPDSYKTRRGKIGGYRDYLEPAACDEIDRYLADELDPFYVHRYIHPDADTGDRAGVHR